LQPVFPQHVLLLVTQNGEVPVRQHFAPEAVLQERLPVPQQSSAFGRHVVPQQWVLLSQFGHCGAASTELIPNVASMPPATKPPSRFSACRRGISLARMRAALSKK
jgi:hypothetical protein